jgi:general secretion pathway protein M
MSLADRLQGLEERERRLLGILVAMVVGAVLLLPPVALYALVHSRRSEVEEIRAAIQAIEDERETVERAKAGKGAIEQRYARPAPPLAAFLARLASEAGVEIPESQDRQAVPHGKRFEERTTKITLRKVGLLKLVKFLEKIEQAGHPVRISQFDIRKRGSEPDSYDVDLIVSAFDRKAEPKAAAKSARDGGAAPRGSAVPGESDEDTEEQEDKDEEEKE